MPDYKSMKKGELVSLLETLESRSKRLEQGDPRKVIHELQVHQVELEMQNRALNEAREELEDARDRYADLYDSAPVGYVVMDMKGVIEDVNLTAADMLGMSTIALKGVPLVRFAREQERRALYGTISRAGKQDRKMTAQFTISKNGGGPVLEAILSRVTDRKTGKESIRAALTDVTERSKAEGYAIALAGEKAGREEAERGRHQLEESQAIYTALGETVPYGIWISDAEGGMQYLSRSFLDLIGRQMEECMGQEWITCLPVDDKKRVVAGLKRRFRSGRPFEMEFRIRRGGKFTHILSRGIPIRDGGGITRWAGINYDITAIRETEEALAKEEERLSVTLRSLAEGVITTDNRQKVSSINREAEAMTGWQQREAEGQDLKEVLRLKDRKSNKSFAEPVSAVSEAGENAELTGDLVLIDKRGGEKLIAGRAADVKDRHGKEIGKVIAFRDITGRKKMEEELLRTEKLESIGALASGIVRQFTEVLTSMRGYIENAKEDAKGRAADNLSEAEKMIKVLNGLSYQLMSYIIGAPFRKELSYAEDIVRQAVEQEIEDSGIEAIIDIPAGLHFVEIDQDQIRQAFAEILRNAREASPSGGKIEIRMRNAEVKDGEGQMRAGQYVETSIKDHGTGIPGDKLGRIFEPFFAMKAGHAGLGLTIAYSVVKRHSGQIFVEPAEGAGTIVRVFLPA